MKIAVTGIAGFLGSHLADAFLARGDTVIGVDNLIGGYLDNIPKGAEFYQADCRNIDLLRVILRGVDVVYHLAATAHEGLSVFSPYDNAEHGYAASAAVFSASVAAGVKRVVFTSSMARYGTQETLPFTEDMAPKPQDPYGIGKVASENLLKLLGDVHGMSWCVAVPHNLIGPRQRYCDPHRNVAAIMINLMLQGRRPIIYGDGSQKRCFSFVSDAVEPLVKMGLDPACDRETINIGPDDEFISINDLAKEIEWFMHSDVHENPHWPPIYKESRPQEVHLANCSAAKARTLLGYTPKVKLRDGLQLMIDYIQTRGVRAFDYRLPLEIVSDKTPITWRERLF